MQQNDQSRKIYILAAVFGLVLITGVIILIGSRGPSAAQQQLAAQQKSLASSAYADPILKYLPYGDIGYNINPVLKTIDSKHVLTLQVDIILDDSDYRSTPAQLQTTIVNREQSAQNYIRSKGLDPAKYRIEYNVPAH